MYAELAPKMETFVTSVVNNSALQLQASKMHTLLNTLMAARRHRENDSVVNLLSRVVEGLIEGLVNVPEHVEQMKLYRDIHLRILSFLHTTFGTNSTARATTKCIFECREEVRYNFEAIKLLINSHFVNMQQFDLMLSQVMDNGNNYLAVTFAMQLVQHYLIDERASNIITEHDLYNTFELLAKLAAHHRGPEGLTHLIELLRINYDPNTLMAERPPAGPLQFIHLALMHVKVS